MKLLLIFILFLACQEKQKLEGQLRIVGSAPFVNYVLTVDHKDYVISADWHAKIADKMGSRAIIYGEVNSNEIELADRSRKITEWSIKPDSIIFKEQF